MTLTDNYQLLLAIRVLNGLSDGVVYPAALVLVSEYLEEKDRAVGVVAILGGTAMAAVIGLPLTIEVLEPEKWQEVFRWFTGVSLVGTVVSGVLLPLIPGKNDEGIREGFNAFMASPRLRKIAGANIAGDVAWFGALTFVGSFLVHEYNPSLHQLALFYFAAGLAFVVGSFLATSSDFETQQRLSIVSSIASTVLAPIFFIVAESFVATLAIAIVYAFLRAPGISAMDNMLITAAENTTTRVVSGALSSIVSGIAIFVAAAIGGVVLDSTAYTTIGLIFGVSAMGSVLMLWKLKEGEGIVIEENKDLAPTQG